MANKKKIKNINRGWLFLGVMLFVYALTVLIDFSLAHKAWILFTTVLVQVLPILVMVFILMVIINYILSPKQVRRYLGQASGLKGWLLAIIGGIFATGPIYSWYILLADLKQQGMKSSLVAVFLYSRAVKLPLLPLLIHYFGLTYTLLLSFYLIMFSVLSGILTGLLVNEET